jgi:hypothetical protein
VILVSSVDESNSDVDYRHLIWIGSDQEKTFGPTISGLIHRNLGPDRVTLWDSKKRGLNHLITNTSWGD